MKSQLTHRCALLVVAAVVLTLGAARAGAQPIPSGSPGVDLVAQNGFGDSNNSYAWSMGWFHGKLYVGTGRDELCLEEETIDFYYPVLHEYSTHPGPNVRCTANPYDLPLRAEIWSYAPRTHRWTEVYRSPTVRNDLNHNRPIARDLAYRGMAVMKSPRGRRALFAGAVTPDEFTPQLRKSHPPVLMRTYDGVHWQTLHLPAVWVHFPTGRFRPMGYRSLVVWRHRLYVTATPDLTGDGGLFEVTRPFSSRPGLRQVSDHLLDIFEVATFDGGLYLGTGNAKTGYGVYRTFRPHGHPYYRFRPVLSDGAGRGSTITSVVSMHVFRNRLYVGASGWYNQDSLPLSEMVRIAPNGHWTLVVGAPRKRHGITLYPTSGLGDGFDDIFNAHFWRMATYGGAMYAGTNNWDYLLQTDSKFSFLQSIIAGSLGFDMWATCNGNAWFPVTWNAFNSGEYNFGSRTLQTGGGDSGLFIGSANQAQGTTIYEDRDPVCGSLVNRDVARPRGLETDRRARGTLLTWRPSAGARSYEILAAPLTNVTLNLAPPPALPNGFRFEDETPIFTAPGAPGSVAVTLPVPGAFAEVADTRHTYFVNPGTGRDVYEVVARSATGAASRPSNIATSPAAQPAATFGAVRRTLGSERADAARVARPGAAGARESRLLRGAQVSWRRDDRAAALARLRRLAADAGDNDELAFATARLERRLQYAGVGGGR